MDQAAATVGVLFSTDIDYLASERGNVNAVFLAVGIAMYRKLT